MGGNQYVLDALKGECLASDNINVVMYTHLHNDHAGGCTLFPNSLHLFQKDGNPNMLNPLPSQKNRTDYDPRMPDAVAGLKYRTETSTWAMASAW